MTDPNFTAVKCRWANYLQINLMKLENAMNIFKNLQDTSIEYCFDI